MPEPSHPGGKEPRSRKTILFAEGVGLRQSVSLAVDTTEYRLMIVGSGAAALQLAREFDGPIHLLIANVQIPDMTGMELAQRLSRLRPDTKIFLLSNLESGVLVLNHRWHFLPAPFELEMLRSRIRDVMNQPQPFLSQLALSPPNDTGNAWERLTKRELEVLKLIATGDSTKQVATSLGIAFKTSVGHRSRLMKKLGIHDSVALVRYAIRAGLINP